MAEQKALNKNFLIAAVLGLGILSGLLGYNFAGKNYFHKKEITPVTPQARIISFKGFPEGTKAVAEIKINDGASSPLTVEDGHLVLNEEQIKELRAPYIISATFQLPDGTYRDFSWSLQSNGAWYDFLADGFRPKDKILFSTNKFVGDDMPFDWSGKFVYPMVLEVKQEFSVCFDITETAANRKLSLCQFKSGMKQG